MEANETLLVLRLAEVLDVPVSASAESTVVATTKRSSLNCIREHVGLVVAITQEVEVTRVLGIANRLQDHIVSLLEGDISDILHGLHEGRDLAECLLGLLLVVHSQRVLVVNIVATPEVLAEHPRENEFRKATPLERRVIKQSGASLLAEVSISEHGRVRIVIGNTTRLALVCLSGAAIADS